MAWLGLGNNPVDYKGPIVDLNRKMLDELKGELSEEVARTALGAFLKTNIGYTVELLTGKILEPYQRIVVKGWMQKNFSVTVASRSFGKCIDRNAIVLTDNGLCHIKDVQVGEHIWADKGMQTILAKVENPKETGRKITTNRGYTCEGKMGHKIKIFNPISLEFEWKNIEDFEGQEIIPLRYGMNRWGDSSPIADYQPESRSNSDQSSRPITLSEDLDLYYMMGVILGDGSMRQKNMITVCSMDKEIESAFRLMVEKYMPSAHVKSYTKDNNQASDYRACSSRFKTFLNYMGFNNQCAHEKIFPTKILSVNQEKMAAFLRGLFDTDGGATLNRKTNRCTIEFSSASYDIISKVQAILLNYGVLSTLRHKHKAGIYRFSNGKDYQTHDAWDLAIFDRRSIEMFSEKIGFGIKRKQNKLDQYLLKSFDGIYKHNMLPVGQYFKSKYGAKIQRQFHIGEYTYLSVARLSQFLQTSFLDEDDKIKIRNILDANCYFEPILGITETETETIDIQVDKEECYWSNGFINHNSTIASHFCYLYCLFNPGHHILVCAATFRSSRQIVERVDEWARSKRGILLKQTIEPLPNRGTMTKRQDLLRITFKNGSSIVAVPMGDPDNLLGFRCNVLLIDEGRLISQNTIDMVLKPFLAGGADATKKQKIRRKEKRMIAEGKMTQREQVKFKADSKMIIISSASYKWEEFAALYRKYRAIIESTDQEKRPKAEEHEAGVSSYLVHQMSYEITAPHLMDAGILQEIREKLIPQSVIDREYKAWFIDESGGFFSAKQMAECTIPPGERPCVEIVGDKNAEYILGIDPAGGAIGANPAGDHFAMCVLKVLKRKDGKKIGLVVHQYACAGIDLKHHIAYLYYILKRFNIVYIVIDSSGGSIVEFIKTCNESEVFKHGKMELNSIDAEFAKDDLEETIKAVKRSYNPDSSLRRIVHNQFFSPAIIKAGNDHLRACFEQKTIQFASHAQSVPHAVEQMCQADIMGIHNSHPEFHDSDLEGSASMWEFCTNQDQLIELVKIECALIEVTSTPLGNLSFDLPHHMTRDKKNPLRRRKDSYSALWLAAWGLKIMVLASEMPEQESDDTFAPMLIG